MRSVKSHFSNQMSKTMCTKRFHIYLNVRVFTNYFLSHNVLTLKEILFWIKTLKFFPVHIVCILSTQIVEWANFHTLLAYTYHTTELITALDRCWPWHTLTVTFADFDLCWPWPILVCSSLRYICTHISLTLFSLRESKSRLDTRVIWAWICQ